MRSAPPPGRPDVGAGDHAPGPETYQSALLREHAEAMAQDATSRFFTTWPKLLERYGERGRRHTYNDCFWHLSTLDAALLMGRPTLFLEYVDWLRGFLAGRGMADDIGCANFVYFRAFIAQLPATGDTAPERERLLDYLDQAIECFPEAARTPPAQPMLN